MLRNGNLTAQQLSRNYAAVKNHSMQTQQQGTVGISLPNQQGGNKPSDSPNAPEYIARYSLLARIRARKNDSVEAIVAKALALIATPQGLAHAGGIELTEVEHRNGSDKVKVVFSDGKRLHREDLERYHFITHAPKKVAEYNYKVSTSSPPITTPQRNIAKAAAAAQA